MLMATSPYPKCLFLLFLFLLHASLILATTTESSTSVVRPGKDLITATCKRTSNFYLCNETLHSDGRSSKSDVKGLAQISLEKSLTKTNQTLYSCGDLFKDNEDPMLQYRLEGTCIVEFRQAVEKNLPGALRDLKANKYGASKFGADEAVRHADRVIEACAGRISMVLGLSLIAKDFCSIASSIVSQLQ